MLESLNRTWFSDGHYVPPKNEGWGWQRCVFSKSIVSVQPVKFRDKDFYVIQGQTAAPKRHNMIQKFNDASNKRGRLFFCSDAGAIGTNMTGATRVVVFEAKHNPAVEIQAIFRAYRIGQTQPVHVYRLISQVCFMLL